MAREWIHRGTVMQVVFELVEDGPNGRNVVDVKQGQEEVREFSEAAYVRQFRAFDQARQQLPMEPGSEEPSPNGKPARQPRGKSRRHAQAEETEKTHALN